MKPKRICIITFGTVGDVQPYIALGLGLKNAGHLVTIATLEEYKSSIVNLDLDYFKLRGDYLKAAINSDGKSHNTGIGNPLKLIREYVDMARETLMDEWNSAQGCDALVYNMAALGGYHLAEKLGIPAFASFPAPLYTPTREFPSPFLPFRNLGPFNQLSHRFFAAIGPAMYHRPINEWRKNVLALPPLKDENHLRGKPVTKLYAFSQAVVPRPSDWDESSVITGYWFLDKPADWKPDSGLVEFLRGGSPPVYFGFGSMFMNGGKRKTEIVIDALRLAGQRGILSAGWGGLSADSVPTNIHMINTVPHDWLFPKMAAVVHHGGAGTTGAVLRSGKPMVICPFVGDQSFWGYRASKLGVAYPPIPQRKLTSEILAESIVRVLKDDEMQRRARAMGEKIRHENGVAFAVDYINRHLSN